MASELANRRCSRTGASVAALPRPGWWVKVRLKGTKLENAVFEPVSENIDQTGFPAGPRWIDCRVSDGKWSGAGDETTLERILELFLSWAEGLSNREHPLQVSGDIVNTPRSEKYRP